MRYVISLAILLAACGKEKPAEPVAVSDSSGVHIVMNRTPAWTPGTEWKVGGKPTLQIGGGVTDTSTLVGPVAGAFRLGDGRVIVADEGARALRWFSSDGTPLFTAGREGDGPGEFRDISRLLEIGDSIVVYDAQLRRLSFFDTGGKFGRSISITHPRDPRGLLKPIGRLSTGGWIATQGSAHSTGQAGGARRDSVWLWTLDPTGEAQDSIALLPGNDVLVASGENFIGDVAPPFGRRTTVHFHDDGLWVGTGDNYRIDELDLQGRHITSIRLARPPEPVPPDVAKHVTDSVRRDLSGGAAGMEREVLRATLKAFEDYQMPKVMPAFATFRIADDGALWVEHYVPEHYPGATQWDVFLSDGRLQGTITLPPGFFPTQISQDEVLGVWKDPDGVDHVVAYPLEHGMIS